LKLKVEDQSICLLQVPNDASEYHAFVDEVNDALLPSLSIIISIYRPHQAINANIGTDMKIEGCTWKAKTGRYEV